MAKHELHLAVGNLVAKEIKGKDTEVVRDTACGGSQQIPLFLEEKERGNVITNVDLMILKDNKIKVIVEIEESNLTPLHICGKFLAPLLGNKYIHSTKEDKEIEMDNVVMFIQILDKSKLPKNSKKEEQGKKIEEAINKFIEQDKKLPIKEYKLIYGAVNSFANGDKGKELIRDIMEFLGKKIDER